MHICIIWLQCVKLEHRLICMKFCFNSFPPSAAYMCQWIVSALVQIMLVAYSTPCHYLNHCWAIINWTLTDKLQWNFNQNTKLFIYKNTPENIIWEMAAILSRGKWVNIKYHLSFLRPKSYNINDFLLNLISTSNIICLEANELQHYI